MGLKDTKERNTVSDSKAADTDTESYQHQNMNNNKAMESETMEGQLEISKLVRVDIESASKAQKMPSVTRLTCCVDLKQKQESVIAISTRNLESDVDQLEDGGAVALSESTKDVENNGRLFYAYRAS